MKGYIDLVLCREEYGVNRALIMSAPFNSCLKSGDIVTWEQNGKVFPHRVIMAVSVSTDSEEYAFIKALHKSMTETEDFLRIAGKVDRLDYSDEDYMKGIE